jgi:hypothetical protein
MYPLRSNNCKLYLEKPKTDFMKKSFSYRGAASWNNLPNDVTNNYNELSISNFKTLVNNYFTILEKNSVWQPLVVQILTRMSNFWVWEG